MGVAMRKRGVVIAMLVGGIAWIAAAQALEPEQPATAPSATQPVHAPGSAGEAGSARANEQPRAPKTASNIAKVFIAFPLRNHWGPERPLLLNAPILVVSSDARMTSRCQIVSVSDGL